MEKIARQSFEIAELRDGCRREQVDRLLEESRREFERARQDSSMSVVDWILINELLDRSQSQRQQALQISQAEPYRPSYASDSYSSTSYSSDSYASDSYSPSSSFDSATSSSSGSFDSGSSGGGGGFSGGSGSDGSY